MSSKFRIVGYGRESTRDQARYGFNLDDQEKKIEKYVDIYYEDDVSTEEQSTCQSPWFPCAYEHEGRP